MTAAAKKSPSTPEPNKLVRQKAGTYRSADDRFEIRGEGSRWFLIDAQRTDELGQELVQGPFATLEAIRSALPEARRATIQPLASRTAAREKPERRKTRPEPAPTWIDRLPKSEAAAVRRLIRALEREGVDHAEQLVRRDREGLAPVVATRLLERRLEAIVEDFPEDGREAVRALVRRVAAVLSDEGGGPTSPLPGWVLVEVEPAPEPENRRIRLPE